MSNIVYVLTNPAMPGIVKIGMTDRADVRDRMGELFSTGVPIPFDCVMARQIEGMVAVDIENALHTAFEPDRINRSREFFELDPEQVLAVLRVMPGRDVTPEGANRSTHILPSDQEASSEFKRRRARTNKSEFLDSLSENGRILYERILALDRRSGVRINWGLKGFSLNAISEKIRIPVCNGYPPSAFNQRLYTNFDSIEEKSRIPQAVVETLRTDALDTRLFAPVGKGNKLVCETDRTWDEPKLAALLECLGTVLDQIREYETSVPDL